MSTNLETRYSSCLRSTKGKLRLRPPLIREDPSPSSRFSTMVQFDCGADRTLTLSVSVASRPITQSDIDMFDTLIEIVHNSKVHGGVCHMLIYTFYYVLYI